MKKNVSLLLGVLALCGCETRATLDDWFVAVEEQRVAVEKEMNNVPYKNEQQAVFKTYFKSISDFASSMSSDEAVRKSVNKRLLKEDMGSVCKRSLVIRSDWQTIVKNCTKNQFFLCAEEVRKYESNITAIQSQLVRALQEAVKAVPDCKLIFN